MPCLFSLPMIAAFRLAGALYMEGAVFREDIATLVLSGVDASFTNNSAGVNGGNDSRGKIPIIGPLPIPSLYVFKDVVVFKHAIFCFRAVS